MTKYYLYVPGIEQKIAPVYDTFDKAHQAHLELERKGEESYICEFGYPFA